MLKISAVGMLLLLLLSAVLPVAADGARRRRSPAIPAPLADCLARMEPRRKLAVCTGATLDDPVQQAATICITPDEQQILCRGLLLVEAKLPATRSKIVAVAGAIDDETAIWILERDAAGAYQVASRLPVPAEYLLVVAPSVGQETAAQQRRNPAAKAHPLRLRAGETVVLHALTITASNGRWSGALSAIVYEPQSAEFRLRLLFEYPVDEPPR